MECRLTRLNSVHRNLRTDEIVGECPYAPVKGAPFYMSASPLDPAADVRSIVTTRVTKTTSSEAGGVIEFETKNSVYKWEHPVNPGSSEDRASVS